MAGTRVEGASIINTVRYSTDRGSLKRVRKDLKNLQQQFGKANLGGSGPGAARDRIRSSRKTAQADVDAHVKAYRDAIKARSAKKNDRSLQRNLDNLLGINKQGKSARDSADIFKAAFDSGKGLSRKQTEEMNRYSRAMINQQKTIDDLRQKTLAARAVQEKRDRNANRMSNDFAFEAGRLKLQAKSAAQAARSMETLNRRYREGTIDLADYRQQQRHLLRGLRDESKENRTLGQRIRDLRKGGDGGMGLGGAALGLATIGAIGGGYLAVRAGVNALGSGVNQSRGLSRVQSMGLATNETQSLQLAALRATGFDLSYEKISDIAKDTQDKVGQLSLGKWTQNKKSGEWSFGGGGELGDWVKIMTERGGYSREGAINTLQSAKGPVEFAIILENLRKQANLTDKEFTALAEAINDFSYIAKSIGPDGQNLVNTLQELSRVGLLYTDREMENLRALSDLAATFTKTSEFLQGKFAAAFVEGMEKVGISSKNLSEEMAGASPAIKSLGEFAGETAARFLQLLNAIPGWSDSVFGTRQVLNSSGAYYDDSTIGGFVNWVRDAYFGGSGANWTADGGFNTKSVMQDRYQTSAFNNPYGFNSVNNPSTLNLQIEVTPNAEEFRSAFDVHAREAFDFGMNNQVWDINQSLLKN